jgi:hypothetical protein
MSSAEEQELSSAVRQHVIEFSFVYSEPVRCQSPWSAGDRWAWYGPDVMNSVVAHFALDSDLESEGWEFGEEVVDRCAVTDDLHA